MYIFVTQELETRFLTLVIPAIIFLTEFILDFPNLWESRINEQAHPLGCSSYNICLSHPFRRVVLQFFTTRYIFYFCRLVQYSRECIACAIRVADKRYILNSWCLRKCDKLTIRD
jgi:hypothetical protein